MGKPALLWPAAWLTLLSLVCFPACGGDGEEGGTRNVTRDFVYPDPVWKVEAPETHDLDSILLEEAADLAEENTSNCLVVTRDGVIVGEWYWNDWGPTSEQNVFSVTKSFTSALVGIAQERGELDITERASEYITEWVGTPSEDVTIQNLISNDSGRHWDFWTDYVQNYALADDKTAHAIGLGHQYDPGTVWKYNNSAIQTLECVLNEATGMDVADYAQQYLFEPLGMSSSYGRDRAGNPLTYADLSASCRDLARFGYLYLREGRWENDQQVVTGAWVEESTQPSTPLNSAYGYMWWLNREGPWVAPSFPDHEVGEGKAMRNLPENVYQANGAFNQIIFVDPDTDIVFTRIGWALDIESIASNVLVEGLAERIRAARLDN
jgi:CubicO group peptidase (beta-lactamase class C family)